MTTPPQPDSSRAGRRPESADEHDLGSIFGPEYRVLTLGVISVMTIVAFEAMGVITAMPTAARELDGLSLYAWGSTAVTAAALYAMAAAGGWADRTWPGAAAHRRSGRLRRRHPRLRVRSRPCRCCCSGEPCRAWASAPRSSRSTSSSAARTPSTCGRGCSPRSPVPGSSPGSSARWSPGCITDAFGWRWVFFGVLVLLIPVGAVLLPRLQAMHVDPDPDAAPAPGRKRLALMAAVGVVLLQVAGQRLDATSLAHRAGRARACWRSRFPGCCRRAPFERVAGCRPSC